jgi:DNA-binding response OmpR family regulator
VTGTVLIVEDNEDICELLVDILGMNGVETRQITSHFEVCFAPETWDGVDVALVDLMLPVVPGTEVLAWLQSHFPQIKRIGMTAGLSAAGEVTGLASHLLLKPFSTETLLEAIGP